MSGAGPKDLVVAGLQSVLAAEHACVYGYPVIGTQLSDAGQRGQAHADEAAHRLARDALAAQLNALGVTPVAADIEYQPPNPVRTAATAQQWAVQLEDRLAAAYRYLVLCAVRADSAPARKQAVDGLIGAAAGAVYWRRLSQPDAPTVAFPGTG